MKQDEQERNTKKEHEAELKSFQAEYQRYSSIIHFSRNDSDACMTGS